MRFRQSWNRAGRYLLLVGLGVAVLASPVAAATRHYYIAAEEYVWDYAPTGRDLVSGGTIPQPWRDHTRWPKVRYIEYLDASFTTMKPQPSWLGILGPRIVAEVGDTVQVHFANRTDDFQTLQPQGVRVRQADAAFHAGGRPQVPPGGSLTYEWVIDAESGPGSAEPSSVVRWYGPPTPSGTGLEGSLLGPVIITRRGMARPDGSPKDIDREFVLLFKVSEEAGGYGKGRMHSINGYIFGNLPGLIARNGEQVRWHILDLGTQAEVRASLPFAVPANLAMKGVNSIRFSTGTLTLTDVVADEAGTWALRGQEPDHVVAGMAALYTVMP